jgi:predicted GTPase
MKKVIILGAAGRDFHNFNVVFRDNPNFEVVAFTATQIPDIANRRYPANLAGRLYPTGIPILEEKDLERLISEHNVNTVVFSYSDVSHQTLMHLASRTVAADADFWLLGTERTQVKARVPVISICAVRTGCGKSPVSRLVAQNLRHLGWNPVVIRHPMPYGDLSAQAVQRFATMEDMDRHQCTIEERDIILWDGGNNDTPFYASELEIVVVDPHRPGHEMGYYPGEVNLRRAKVVIINKVDTASSHNVEIVRNNIQQNNPAAIVIETACRVSVSDPSLVKNRRVLVVEDGPTLTHGEMSYGAGVVAARQCGAAELVDPRPFAIGSIRGTYERFPHLTSLLPAMGYGAIQRHELEETINRVPCDLVLVATPVNLAKILKLNKPSVRVSYEAEELAKPGLAEVLTTFTAKYKPIPAEMVTR